MATGFVLRVGGNTIAIVNRIRSVVLNLFLCAVGVNRFTKRLDF